MTAAPVHEEPEISMPMWAIVLSASGAAHIGGMHRNTRLRLSTAIESFDLQEMTATTRSGRTYRLEGVRNDAIGIAAIEVFHGAEAARDARAISPDELALMLAEPANGWRA